MKRVSCCLFVLGLLGACTSMSVQTDSAPDVDFAQFKTFGYQESEMSFATSAPLSDQRIVAALRRVLAAAGLTEVEADPDVYVSYYGSTERNLQFQTVYTGVGRRWSRWGAGMSTATTRATTVTQGTLMIDIWDARENQLIWRGVVSNSVSGNPDRDADRINRGIERAFRDFPPR